MAGDLHHHGVDAAFEHHGEQRLQVGGFGSGQPARQILARDPHADGADKSATRPPARRPASTR